MMKWVIVVLWSVVGTDGNVDAYVFTQPIFNSKEQCVAHALDPKEIPKYIQKLAKEGMFINKETGEMQPINKVICSPVDKVKEIISLSKDLEI